ncbi:hypothetical protein D0Y65_046461 [Glycine soja]|uniref:Uncharacterized protein n=1 Tax=Glycine soja TaxID=3848 RepID=A0A445G9E1_GLYSO|nr:hypothetical protein D0Y65_046461 [Glycine soja]
MLLLRRTRPLPLKNYVDTKKNTIPSSNPDSLTQEKVVDQISVVLDVLCLHHRNVWFKWQRRLPCVLFRRVGRSWKRSTNAPKSSLGSCRRRLR